MSNGRKYFRTEGVVVLHPALGKPYEVQGLPMPSKASLPAVAGGFDPFRLVINFKVVDHDHPRKTSHTFKPPMEVRVRFTDDDLQQAAARGKPLRLGYWDGTKWEYFTPAAHDFKLKRKRHKKLAGWGYVKLSTWGDPPKGWGT